MIENSRWIVACVAVLFAMWQDARTGRIPNALILSTAGVGFAISAVCAGWNGAIDSVSGMVIGLLLLLLPFALGWMGGGDVKLLAAVGSYVGPGAVVRVFVASIFAGGIISLVLMIKRKVFFETLAQLKTMGLTYFTTGAIPSEKRPAAAGNAPSQRIVPFSAAIAIGVLVAGVAEKMGWW